MLHSICDGSAALRLRVFVEAQPGRESRGSVVRVENGFSSFAVDGTCSYLIGGGWIPPFEEHTARDEGWRVGQVDDAFRAAIDGSLGMDDLSSLDDCVSSAGMFDFSTTTIRNQHSTARCVGTPGARFSAAWAVIEDRAADLWARAKPLTQGIHLAASEAPSEAPGGSPPYQWPSGYSLDAYMLDGMQAFLNTPGSSKLIPAADAPTFRALRDQFIADVAAAPVLYQDGQKMTDGTRIALVYMRDALPYEDASGLLPFSGGQ
jgi:hypothetical protein